MRTINKGHQAITRDNLHVLQKQHPTDCDPREQKRTFAEEEANQTNKTEYDDKTKTKREIKIERTFMTIG